jgi:two-component system chemotaxis response regulator CheB
MDPVRHSHLVEILARWTALPVRFAADDDALVPGVVLVVPPGRHALATMDGRLCLIASGVAPPSRPSADLLLASLAITAGPRAIAVVLSGAGHDGATGATAVHDLGGIVIASDRPSSMNPSMPLAAVERDEIVDYVAAVDDIAGLLTRLVRRVA